MDLFVSKFCGLQHLVSFYLKYLWYFNQNSCMWANCWFVYGNSIKLYLVSQIYYEYYYMKKDLISTNLTWVCLLKLPAVPNICQAR